MKNLEKLLELRNNISKLQFEIEGLMPEAVGEAIEVLGTSENTKNKTVYQNNNSKIVLVFKKQYETPQTDLKLNRLESDIRTATAKLSQNKANDLARIESEIEKHQQAIAELELERNRVMFTSYLSRLKKEYELRRQETMTLKPTLSVFL
jgi:multidrug efflux pump subunit AcrA (membrane-fusion protein)